MPFLDGKKVFYLLPNANTNLSLGLVKKFKPLFIDYLICLSEQAGEAIPCHLSQVLHALEEAKDLSVTKSISFQPHII